MRSPFGYTFDHASPIGEIVLASPTHQRVIARLLRGVAAHAGLRGRGRPQRDPRRRARDRRDAARPARSGDDRERRAHRRWDGDERRAQALPRRAEARSLSEELVEAALTDMIDCFQDADAAECDLDLTVEKMFHRLPAEADRAHRHARRKGAAGDRLRAASDRHRRWRGRERVHRSRV